MPVGDFLKKLEDRIRGVAEAPFEEARHPLTVRRRVLEAVEDRVEAAGGPGGFRGRLVIYLLAEEEPARQVLEQVFAQDEGLVQDVRQRLREVGVADPEAVAVEVRLVPAPEPGLSGLAETGCAVVWTAPASRQVAQRLAAPDAGFRLVIEKGQAVQAAYTFQAQPVVHVGRLQEVVNAYGHVTRRNEVAFRDEENEVNATVSRAHAYIRYDEDAGAYRLYDEGSACGTSVYRAGQTGVIPVKRRGVTLEDGDLLYFGKACARFERRVTNDE